MEFLKQSDGKTASIGPWLQDIPQQLTDPNILEVCAYHGLIGLSNVGPPMAWLKNRGSACLAERRIGGNSRTATAVVPLASEDKTILETLAGEHPMIVTQEGLAAVTRLSVKCIRTHLKYLRDKGLVNQPLGSRKGFGITPKGLSVIGR